MGRGWLVDVILRFLFGAMADGAIHRFVPLVPRGRAIVGAAIVSTAVGVVAVAAGRHAVGLRHGPAVGVWQVLVRGDDRRRQILRIGQRDARLVVLVVRADRRLV